MPKKYINPEILKSRFTNGYDDYFPLWKIEMFIDDVPAADVKEVKHGEWVYICETPIYYACYKCSECGVYQLNPHTRAAFHYCPSCGAKMDGKANK